MKRVHFVGIKGVAMTALAVWYKESGYVVTGSDTAEQFPTDEILARAGITVLPGFDPGNLGGKITPSLVIYTGAHGGKDNCEVAEAAGKGIPVLPHGIALGKVMEGFTQISVAGSHGKTTTSAMIATVLTYARMDPSYAIGCGEIRGLGLSGHKGKGRIFVAEADEYSTDPGHDMTPRFLWQKPDILVVTNIDFDHPDVYPTLVSVQDAFVKLQQQSKLTIVNGDDPASSCLPADATYGFSSKSEYRATDIRFGNECTFFTLEQNGMKLTECMLKVPGKHNVLNAVAAAIACNNVGVSWEKIKEGLATFGGTKRRFEYIGDIGGVKIIDDYAHHPEEIRATLSAAREWYPDARIIAVFQPHTYSRTKALLSEFAHSFQNIHMVLLTDIYASARETSSPDVTGKTLVEETAKYQPNVFYTPDFVHVDTLLRQHMLPGDIILFMGAGNIFRWGSNFVHAYEHR